MRFILFLLITASCFSQVATNKQLELGIASKPLIMPGDVKSITFGAKMLQPTNMVQIVSGRFWTEWRVETNDSPRRCMEQFEPKEQSILLLTNNTYYIDWGFGLTNYAYRCPKEHLDGSEHSETQYVSSNLIAYLVWRGKTNINYLESIPITNIVRRWRDEKRRVYTQ
jgi:hypothetical protein